MIRHKSKISDVFTIRKFYDEDGKARAEGELMGRLPEQAKFLAPMVKYYVDVVYILNRMDVDSSIDPMIYSNFAINCIVNIINNDKLGKCVPELAEVLQSVMGTFVESVMETKQTNGSTEVH